MGPQVVDLLVALVSLANIEGKTYAQLSEMLQKHYTSGTNELAVVVHSPDVVMAVGKAVAADMVMHYAEEERAEEIVSYASL